MWRPTGAYGLFLRHFGRDSAYTDVRLFKISSTAGPSAECALIRRYLRNSHVAECESLAGEFRFCLKMLAALVDHNFSMGLLWMGELNGPRVDHQLSDYRSLDAVFNGAMRLDALELFHLSEHSFAGLVKTTDLFRMAMVQRLKALKLHLVRPYKCGDRLASVKPSPANTRVAQSRSDDSVTFAKKNRNLVDVMLFVIGLKPYERYGSQFLEQRGEQLGIGGRTVIPAGHGPGCPANGPGGVNLGGGRYFGPD